MKDSFHGYYTPDKAQLSELWANCIFILDANVLLGFYRYPSEAREDLLTLLRKVSERLWIPHQVALEYQENRLNVISEQIKKYHEVRQVIEKNKNKLVADIGNLQLSKRHSSIKPDAFLKQISQVFDKFLQELEELESKQLSVRDFDLIREDIDMLLKGKIGPPPNSQDDLEQIYKEGEIRYFQRRPPGYMDQNKEKELGKQGEKVAYCYKDLIFGENTGI